MSKEMAEFGANHLSLFPAINSSSILRASSSENCFIGCFMKYAEGEISTPPVPLSRNLTAPYGIYDNTCAVW